MQVLLEGSISHSSDDGDAIRLCITEFFLPSGPASLVSLVALGNVRPVTTAILGGLVGGFSGSTCKALQATPAHSVSCDRGT
jgi:hypothetical protein